MKIRVDWFKQTGKWYCGEEVEIGEALIWQPEFKQAIVDNQTQLHDAWPGDFHVVTGDLQKYDDDPQYTAFNHAFFSADKWLGMRKCLPPEKKYLISQSDLQWFEEIINKERIPGSGMWNFLPRGLTITHKPATLKVQ